jgi:hypothetical protein
MQVLQALDDLIEEFGDEGRVKAVFVLFDKIEQIAVEVFEDKIYLSLLLEGLLNTDHIVAFEHLEHFYFSLDGAPRKLVLITLFELLNGNSLPLDVPKPPFSRFTAFHTIPYAPSSITSKISYFCILYNYN